MRVFLTGAGGFIGRHTLHALATAGHEVLALERDRPVEGGPCEVLRGDLADLGSIRDILQRWRPEACIHLAWYVEPGVYLDSADNVAMLQQSLELLQVLLETGCRQVVTAGTCAEYDAEAGWLREGGPTRPETLYAACKLSLGEVGRQMALAAGVRLSHVRIFYPYGPGEDRRRMVPALALALLGGQAFPASHGLQVRDYIHVGDVAEGLRVLAEAGAEGIYNVASGAPVTVRGLMETVGEIAGGGHLIRFGEKPPRKWEPPFIGGAPSRLRALGWAPKRALHEGLAETVDWWRGNAD